MSIQKMNSFKIFSILAGAVFFFTLNLSADTTDLQSALDNSLQEHQEIIKRLSLNRMPAAIENIQPLALKAGKTREQIDIDFEQEEADTKNASNYGDISEIVERKN